MYSFVHKTHILKHYRNPDQIQTNQINPKEKKDLTPKHVPIKIQIERNNLNPISRFRIHFQEEKEKKDSEIQTERNFTPKKLLNENHQPLTLVDRHER